MKKIVRGEIKMIRNYGLICWQENLILLRLFIDFALGQNREDVAEIFIKVNKTSISDIFDKFDQKY